MSDAVLISMQAAPFKCLTCGAGAGCNHNDLVPLADYERLLQDRRDRVQKVIADNPDKPTREVAAIAGVHYSTVSRARKSGVAHATTETVTGKDGKRYKARKQPKVKKQIAANLKLVGLTVAIRNAYQKEYSEDLPQGFSQDTLGRKPERGGSRHLFVAELGEAIQDFIEDNGPVAIACARIVRRLHLQRDPQKLEAEISAIRAEVPESARAKFDRLVQKAVDLELAKLRARFKAAVDQATQTEREALAARRKQMDDEQEEFKLEQEAINATSFRDVTPLMTKAEFQLLRLCLHTDRIEGLRGKVDDAWLDKELDRLRRASSILNRLEKNIDYKVGVQILRERGWAAQRDHAAFVDSMGGKKRH